MRTCARADVTGIYPTMRLPTRLIYYDYHIFIKRARASFVLNVKEPGLYNVSMWWPRAMPAMLNWSTNVTVTVAG